MFTTCSKLLSKIFVPNSWWKVLFTTFIHNFCSKNLFALVDNFVHNVSPKLLLKTFLYSFCLQIQFTTFVNNFWSTFLFTTFALNFCSQLLLITFIIKLSSSPIPVKSNLNWDLQLIDWLIYSKVSNKLQELFYRTFFISVGK